MSAVVTIYGRPGCHLCDDALSVLAAIRQDQPFELVRIDIESDDELLKRYLERIPVIDVDGDWLCDFFIDEAQLRERLKEAARR